MHSTLGFVLPRSASRRVLPRASAAAPLPLPRPRPRLRPRLPSARPSSSAASTAFPAERAPAAAPTAIRLRNYQEECIQSVLASLERGRRRLGISLATGSGKTVIFTQLVDRVRAPAPGAERTLILAHRRELVEQAARHCAAAYPDKSVEVEMGTLHASGTADITVASIQSVTSGDRIAKFDPRHFKLVLVDEAHHIVAPGYMRALRHFGLLSPPSEEKGSPRSHVPHLIGVSATFSRFDGLRLGAAIDEIVYHRDYVDMIGDRWLSDVVFTTVESTADISRVRSGANKDFQQGELSRAVNIERVNEITVRSWLARAAGQRKSTLVFCVDLSHVAGLTRKFREHGVDAQFVTGDTPKAERGARLEAFKRGEFPVLVNCGVFTEGTDVPNIDCIVLARPTRSRNLLVQMIGRGMRLHPGKENCHVIDMVSSLETGIVTTPTLFGLDPGELVADASVEDMKSLRERRAEEEAARQQQEELGAATSQDPSSQAPISGTVSFTDYGSVFDLLADASEERHIRSISQYAWVHVGTQRYILCGPTGTYLRLERWTPETADDDGNGAVEPPPAFRVLETRALPAGLSKSPWAAPREVLRAATFEDAVHGADKYAADIFPHGFVSRFQRWRTAPPTTGQLEFLNRLRGKGEQALTAADINKGRAADMITKIKHGARGRYAAMEAGRRRREREQLASEQERERRLRETVAVGPVLG